MAGQRLLPQRLELDLGDEYMTPDCARFIKNLSFFRSDTSEVTDNKSGAAGKYKPLESTTVFDPSFSLPAGYNHFLGAYSSKEENCVIFHYYNDLGEHGIYFINGETQTISTVYLDECLNYQLNPENFIHEGGAWLEVFKYNDPVTGLSRKRSYYNYTDGFNDFKFICIEDSIATSGFDATLYPYFVNPHPKCLLINAGVEPPKGCIKLADVPNDNAGLQNNLRFNTWQFMVRYVDVYGRPSEWGDISDIYIPGVNDCIGSSELLARCIDLTFDAGSPLVNIVEIAFRNCNDPQWYKDNSLFLYKGTNLGDWWTRVRNEAINYNPTTNEITYRFCKDKECNPIAQEETRRTQNPLPRKTQSLAKIGKFLGPGNNLHGFFPFGDDIMDKISLTVTPPVTQSSPTRNAEIFVPIYNFYTNTYQPVFKADSGEWAFGGRRSFSNSYDIGLVTFYKQFFGDTDRKGFIGYLAATGEPPIAAISELYYVDETTNEFVKVLDFNIVFQPAIDRPAPFPDDYRRRWYLKFTFNSIAPAKYLFRIADSKTSLTNTQYAKTSATVIGSYFWVNKAINISNLVSDAAELLVDVCDVNYTSVNDNKVLTIVDLSDPANGHAHAVSGYIYEDNQDAVFTFPVELLNISPGILNPLFQKYFRKYTDHNGFYFVTTRTADYEVDFFGMCGCIYQKLVEVKVGGDDKLYEENRSIADEKDGCSDYATAPCNRIKINVTVLECDTGVPVPGVGVVLSRGQYAITGADGTATIIAHDDSFNPSHIRQDFIYYVPTICAFKGCNSVCVEPFAVTILPCTSCVERVIDADLREVLFEVLRGLLSGGNYGVAIWGSDWLGRHQFAQTRDRMYFTTPTLIQTNTFAPSTVTLVIPPDVTFPLWVDEIKVGITKEISMGGVYMTWIVDDVVFVDNGGNENTVSPTQIKIYYGSLIEYNKQNNFNTTTEWQFIVQDESGVNTTTNYTSDFVEFYVNGDGQFFPQMIRALIKYDQAGQYFLIDYDTALKDLKPYAQIRIGRPLLCAAPGVFFQLCGTIKVINGKAQQNTIVLNAFDTYYKYRQIPIPIGTDVAPQNVVRSFGFPFEHHSPSDLWGDHCINIGKINVRNPYESEIIREDQVMLSGALSVNGQLNYLNYFDEDLAIDFNTWNFGGIVSIIPFIGGIRCICPNNCFSVGFNDNTLRANENGQVIVPSADSKFGNPEVKIGNNFGCSLFDKNTIRSKDGLIQFLDSGEAALVQDNYSVSTIVSRADIKAGIVGGVNSWLVAKIKYIQEWNITHINKKYFTGTINPAPSEYLLTDFEIRGNDYVNEEREVNISKNETISFDFVNMFFRQFIGYTPQGYGYLEGQIKNLQLFSFTDKVNYHYSTSPVKTFNTFYGEVVSRVIRPVIVIDGFQKKQFKNITVMGKHLYWSDFNRTDSGQVSRILISQWKQGDFYWGAAILCNTLTPNDPNLPKRFPNNIMDGDKMYGSIWDVRLIGNPADDTIYTELLGLVVEVQPEGKVLP